jgi:hypothetical protein
VKISLYLINTSERAEPNVHLNEATTRFVGPGVLNR